jgi:hypothetical protein
MISSGLAPAGVHYMFEKCFQEIQLRMYFQENMTFGGIYRFEGRQGGRIFARMKYF